MLFTTEQQRALRRRVDALDGLIRSVASPDYWPARSAPASRYTAEFVERLMAHLASADGNVSLEEIRLIQAVHGEDLKWDEELARVRELSSRDPLFPLTVPEFFLAACLRDKATGERIAERMLGEIDAMIETLVRADASIDSAERRIWSTLLATLGDAARQAGSIDIRKDAK